MSADRLERALAALRIALPILAEAARPDTTYGYYPGGDPRDFVPDEECCTPEELARHREACEAWARGETPDPGGPHVPLDQPTSVEPSAAVVGPGGRGWKTVAHYGLGTYTIQDDTAVDAWQAALAVLEEVVGP